MCKPLDGIAAMFGDGYTLNRGNFIIKLRNCMLEF